MSSSCKKNQWNVILLEQLKLFCQLFSCCLTGIVTSAILSDLCPGKYGQTSFNYSATSLVGALSELTLSLQLFSWLLICEFADFFYFYFLLLTTLTTLLAISSQCFTNASFKVTVLFLLFCQMDGKDLER